METYKTTFSLKRLWLILAASMVLMFGTLVFFGTQIYQQMPPIPERFISTAGTLVFSRAEIEQGQNVWQSLGGMQQGSIWGHGSYLAPDWTADWLHREAVTLHDLLAGKDPGQPDNYQTALRVEMRTNTYVPDTGTVTVSPVRAQAIQQVAEHYQQLFQARGEDARQLREAYAFPKQAILNDGEAKTLTAFIFWTSWSASTNRPGDDITYTSNWPHEPLIGNVPTAPLLLWTILSVFLLLAGIGGLVWYYVRQYDVWRADMAPERGFAQMDAVAALQPTPSMLATRKYFWVVTALFLTQVLLGIITAHYAVEGQGFYGFPLAEQLPYVVTRTWHTQLAVLWIATAWLATGLYVGPLLSGYEPPYQRLGVDLLFYSLLVIVVGSFAGEWLAVQRYLPDAVTNFWFGHQGYEYIDLGRIWQIGLFVGLLLWMVLVLRALLPALRKRQNTSLLYLVVISAVAIGLFYGAGLAWGQHTHLSLVEYWRWWVVHLWVEGIFEVFATAIIATLFVRMGLLRASVATVSVLFATIIFLGGGVLGTFHHLYFTGTPLPVIALGAVFSALEVVPLMVVGFEAYNHAKIENETAWSQAYRWPFRFFNSVLVWNMVGAGLFGFLINPPLALYYMQGLNSTANHGHAALFGVYGMLGLGLMLFCLRGLTASRQWNETLLNIAFWGLNIGLAMMTFLSLLPQGLWQTYASIKYGYYFARSAEFVHSAVMEGFVWARVPGDIVFSLGVVAFVAFVVQAFAARRITLVTNTASTTITSRLVNEGKVSD
jgi:nitric oxide reductase subunit B